MDEYHTVLNILVSIILFIISFIVFLFKGSIENISENNLENSANEGDLRAKKILEILETKSKITDISYICLMLFAYSILYLISNNVYIFFVIPFCIILIIFQLSLGIIVPLYLGRLYEEKISNNLVFFLELLLKIFTPILFIVNLFSSMLLKFFGIKSYFKFENLTEENIINMVNEGEEQGILESSEAMMINNIFELNDKDATDVMTNRRNIVGISADLSLSEVVDFMLNEGINSRYPVFSEDIDHILGIINMKDALIHLRKENNKDKKIKNIKGLIRKVAFVPETKSLDELFKDMQAKKQHLVVVIDEYGQTSGIVSLEDILEEIVGDILDEYDTDDNNIVKIDEKTYLIKGMCLLDELVEELGIDIDEEDLEEFETVNGFLISKLGRLPVENDDFNIVYKNVRFICNKVNNKFIESVRLEFIKEIL